MNSFAIGERVSATYGKMVFEGTVCKPPQPYTNYKDRNWVYVWRHEVSHEVWRHGAAEDDNRRYFYLDDRQLRPLVVSPMDAAILEYVKRELSNAG